MPLSFRLCDCNECVKIIFHSAFAFDASSGIRTCGCNVLHGNFISSTVFHIGSRLSACHLSVVITQVIISSANVPTKDRCFVALALLNFHINNASFGLIYLGKQHYTHGHRRRCKFARIQCPSEQELIYRKHNCAFESW